MAKNGSVFGSFARGTKGRRTKSGKRGPKAKRRLRIETLESRSLLSTTCTYIGPTLDNQYGTAANWSTGTVPTSTDNVDIPAESTVQVTGDPAANSVELAYGTTIQGNTTDSLTLASGAITVDSGTAVAAVNLAGSNGLTTEGGTLVATGANTYTAWMRAP